MSKAERGKDRPRIDWEALGRWAEFGLSEAELRAKFRLPENLCARHRAMLEEAIRLGRLLGSANVKEAQYKSALEGRAGAQSRVLNLLDESAAGEAMEVERTIIGGDGQA